MSRALVCLAALFMPGLAVAQECDRSPLMIANVNVWTPAGVVARQDVIISDGRIGAVVPTGTARPIAKRSIDGTGQTMLPGLIDSHVHFSVPGGLPNARHLRPPASGLAGTGGEVEIAIPGFMCGDSASASWRAWIKRRG